jgi:hypothetical protein
MHICTNSSQGPYLVKFRFVGHNISAKFCFGNAGLGKRNEEILFQGNPSCNIRELSNGTETNDKSLKFPSLHIYTSTGQYVTYPWV